MQRHRRFVVVSLLASAGVACTASAGVIDDTERAADVDPPPTDVLVLGTSAGPLLVDAATAVPIGDGTASIASPEGSRLYATTSDGSTTSIVTRDTASGLVVAETRVRGRFDARVASVSGDVVALTEPLPDGVHPWTPIPRASTTIVVADPTGERAPRRLVLDGNFEPEAFSADDRSIFLIEHLPAEAPTAYRVTTLDIATGDLRPVKGRFKVPPQRMPGTRLQQIFDPVRAQLFTLYTNEANDADGAWDDGGGPSTASYGAYGDDATEGDEASGDVTFVHVLNLRKGWAYCAGVPRSFWGQPPRALALATSPDGAILYLVDAENGVVSEMDTTTLEIVRTEDVDLGRGDGDRTSAVTSPDGTKVFIGSAVDGESIHVLDARTLAPLARWAVPGTVRDIAMSGDGRRLYAVLGDAIAVLDPTDGAPAGRLPLGGISEIAHVASAS